MIIFGASGHSKVILDIIDSIETKSINFILDDDRSKTKLLDYTIQHEFTSEMDDLEVVIAIGNNITRKKLAGRISNSFCKALVHSSARISKEAEIGEGSVIMANAVINSSTIIGRHCIINTSAIVEHDSQISDFAHISPGATITGNVKIGEGTQIGAGAIVIPGIEIGKWVTVGAGAVIIDNIPDYAVVVGNPGKILKFNRLEHE